LLLKNRCWQLLFLATTVWLVLQSPVAADVLEQRQGSATLIFSAPRIQGNTVQLQLSEDLSLTIRLRDRGTPEVAVHPVGMARSGICSSSRLRSGSKRRME
jgi:hypothetical protein